MEFLRWTSTRASTLRPRLKPLAAIKTITQWAFVPYRWLVANSWVSISSNRSSLADERHSLRRHLLENKLESALPKLFATLRGRWPLFTRCIGDALLATPVINPFSSHCNARHKQNISRFIIFFFFFSFSHQRRNDCARANNKPVCQNTSISIWHWQRMPFADRWHPTLGPNERRQMENIRNLIRK